MYIDVEHKLVSYEEHFSYHHGWDKCVATQCILFYHIDELQRKLELQKEVFTNCWQYIIQYLSPDDIVDHLISEHLIGNSARQKLSLDKTKDEKNRIIVDELCSGGPDTFEKFCVILKKNSITKHIANRLENGIYVHD